MGYSITIGELEITTHPEDALECSGISFGAKGERHDAAPAFGEPTDFTNSRWPSYSAWSNFAQNCGIYDLLFCDGHLIGGHPGIRLVTKEMLDVVVNARQLMERTIPGLTPTLKSNSDYCRLLWVEYWMRWALKNCKTPIIANS